MHKYQGTCSIIGSAKTDPRTVEAEDLHSASQLMLDEFKAENPGKDCKIVHIRMVNPPVAPLPVTDF